MLYNMLYITTMDVNKEVSLLHVLINNKSSMSYNKKTEYG